MRVWDSGVLGRLSKVFQLSSAPPQEITFQDELLQAVMPLEGVARRGGALGFERDGFFHANITNSHAAATDVVATATPFSGVTAVGNFPQPIPESLDLWIVAVAAYSTGTTGSFTNAVLRILLSANQLAFGTGVGQFILGRWTSEAAIGALTALGFSSGNPENAGWWPMPLRLPRNSTIEWRTRSAAMGAFSYQIQMLLALMPASLGQDVGG